MPLSEARKRANKKWNDNNLDRVAVYLPKGYNDIVKEQADKKGLSKAKYIKTLIDEDIKKEG